MSFSQGVSTGSLSFRPAKFDVEWDGVSEAKASFELTCDDAAAAYSATAYRIWESDGSEVCQQLEYQYSRGDRFYTRQADCVTKVFDPDISLPVTASSGLVTVLFSSVPNTTHVYAWSLKATKSGATKLLVAGKIEAAEPDPYASRGGSIRIVSGVTAYSCF